MNLIQLILRALQILFGIVVLALSATAVHWQKYGTVPATTGYGVFAGVWALLAAIVGIAFAFIESTPDLIMAGIDVLTAIFLFAGGIAVAVGLRGVSCGNIYSTTKSRLLTGGCSFVNHQTVCGFPNNAAIRSRCHDMEADATFLFLGFLASIVTAVLCFMSSRGGGMKSGGSKSRMWPGMGRASQRL